MTDSPRKIALLIDGHSDPITAKTAVSLLRYRPEEVVSVIDQEHAGQVSQELLNCGGSTPVVATIDESAEANTLAIGIAPPGGKLPEPWRPIVLKALARGMTVMSGMHQFLSEDPEFAAAAKESGATLWDVRKNNERDVATGLGIRDDRLRVLTIGNDCSVGKMLTSVEIARGLNDRGASAKLVATGQTGIMVEGDGCPIDCVVSDFVNGAVEKQILAQQDDHEILIVEGQASITHPRYSAVSCGLVHGSRPQGLVVVAEEGRTHHGGLKHVPLPTLPRLIEAYEHFAGLVSPAKAIAVSLNTRLLSPEAAADAVKRVSDELGLPAVDPVREGPGVLCEAIIARKDELIDLARTPS